ncbi:N-acetylmuramidase domain-containing protein [Neomegalonema sp.]|uniref:N-acetylmuramidase domain-containing protein n=1 Tax=Neomegalonema sp. TaxID=2039713 RepID=UPI00262A0EF4|nr:N-acetylmuramidase domain-containing protein [Neomegalonema sp.]MDD2869786.1 N-acetylmuramidase domain-containing protein [Neomegalonema sp.]
MVADVFTEAAALASYDPRLLRAIVQIESGGDVAAWRFEPHVFKRRSAGRAAQARSVAERIDLEAALEATSHGAPQILGENAGLAGYRSASALMADFERGDYRTRLETQLIAMVTFCEGAGLGPSMRALDLERVALLYNGPLAVKRGYHAKLVREFQRQGGSSARVLRAGAFGLEVRVLQEALLRAAHDVEVDGRFGAQTVAAVKAFQEDHGLAVDGVVGARTWEALGLSGSEAATEPPMSRGDALRERAAANGGKLGILGTILAWLAGEGRNVDFSGLASTLGRLRENLNIGAVDPKTLLILALGVAVLWLLWRDSRRAI